MYVIHKKSRNPKTLSYEGATWDTAQLREFYKPTYDSREEADLLCKLLSRHNPVGFTTSKVLEL
jgi:hypothetical protein